MNAGKVSEEIKDAIAYNNAKTINVAISCKEEMGTIFPQPTYQAKIGYAFEVQFIPNLEHYGIKDESTILESVSRLDPTQSLKDCVEFKVKEQTLEEKNKGLYRIEVTILKDKNDILIQPACVELPEVLSVSPEFKVNGINANTPIYIKFNKQMEQLSYGPDGISVKYGRTDLSDYFELPVLNEQRDEVKILPKAEQLINFIRNEKAEYIDINFSLGNSVTSTMENKQYSVVHNEKDSFVIRYSSQIEQTPPIKQIFFVTREEITLETALSLPKEQWFTQESFVTDQISDTFRNKKQIFRNRNNGTIYIYGRYYDSESGVKKVIITERVTHNWKDSSPIISGELFTKEYTATNAQFVTDNEGYTSFCIKHTIKSEEGAVLINVSVEDGCGNKDENSTEQLTVITRTSFYLDSLVVYNTPENFNKNSPLNLETYQNSYKTLKIFNEIFGEDSQWVYDDSPCGDLYETVFGYAAIMAENFTVYADYIDKTGEPQHEQFSDYDPIKGYRSLELNVDTITDLKVKITVIDDIGITGEVFITLAPKVAIYSLTESTGYKNVKFCPAGYVGFNYLQVIEYNEENVTVKPTELENGISKNDLKIYDNPNYKYYVVSGVWQGNNKVLLSEMQPVSVYTGDIQPISVSAHTIKTATEPERLGIEFTIENQEIYDSIFVKSYIRKKNLQDGEYSSRVSECIKDNGESKLLIAETELLYNYDWKFDFTGISHLRKISCEESYYISHITQPEYDNVSPKLDWSRKNWDYYTFTLEDSESGPDACLITIADKSFLLNSENDYTQTIPMGLLNDNMFVSIDIDNFKDVLCAFNYKAYDKAGNFVEKKNTIPNASLKKTIFDIEKDNENLWSFKLEVDIRHRFSTSGWKLNVNYFDNNSVWNETCENLSEAVESQNAQNQSTIFIFSNISLPQNTFIQLIACQGEWYYYPYYLYTGTKNSGTFDHFWELGSSENAISIASDAPVFVHTLYTSRPYNECKDWSVEDWEWQQNAIGIKTFNYSTENHSAQIYNIPVDQISSGYCYVVIAHFADNHVEMSEVMQK